VPYLLLPGAGVRRRDDEEMCLRAVWRWAILELKLRGWNEKKVEYHLHKGDG